jgi:hypothetical protein
MTAEMKAAAERALELVHTPNIVDNIARWYAIEEPAKKLAEAYLKRLAADEAEAAERAKPIDEEWLTSIRARKKAINRWKIEGVNLWIIGPDRQWTVKIDGYHVIFFTRGQLLDLIRALKGGA